MDARKDKDQDTNDNWSLAAPAVTPSGQLSPVLEVSNACPSQLLEFISMTTAAPTILSRGFKSNTRTQSW